MVPSIDAEAIRTHPFKRFLLPFDLYPKFREPQALAGVFLNRVVRTTDRRKIGIVVESVCISYERPQPLRGRAEPPFPLVVKLWITHPDLLLS
jgi:hypothetical protein